VTAARWKPDADEIAAFMRELPRDLGLDPRRAIWTRYIYHYTDVQNAAKILLGGHLLSRHQCKKTGVTFHDAAHQEIIEQSKSAHRYVRLYFRPRTPTQYKMEGINTPEQIQQNGAHCPVPVFFLFDAPCLLGQAGVEFSNGSLARRSGYDIGHTADFLQAIPFDAVYHDSAFPPEQKREIIFRRHAEVLVPDRLSFDCLKDVVCRSGPERATLLTLLGRAGAGWKDRIRLEQRDEGLFIRRGVSVNGVTFIGRKLTIQTNPVSGTYSCTIKLLRAGTSEIIHEESRSPVSFLRGITVDVPGDYERVAVELWIGDALALKGAISQQVLF
jgi:hypothetical protein